MKLSTLRGAFFLIIFNVMRYIYFLMIPIISWGQINEINNSDFYRSGNFLLKELAQNNNPEIEGNPYLNKKFEEGKILFKNGNEYSTLIRLNMGTQKFEIKNSISKEEYEFTLDETANIQLNNKKYGIYSLNFEGSVNIMVLEEIKKGNEFSLFYYPKKNIEIPKKRESPAPASGFEKNILPEWKDYSYYIISYRDKHYRVINSHNKFSKLEIFKGFDYKNYRKRNKLNLKSRESLIDLINELNK